MISHEVQLYVLQQEIKTVDALIRDLPFYVTPGQLHARRDELKSEIAQIEAFYEDIIAANLSTIERELKEPPIG